ncbi:MAG TPA: Fe-S cluster assembly protein SufD [Gemmataceae bacterium]|nr:Fe-S cluster assembly protein SufD [Gemmataceae bacterium]
MTAVTDDRETYLAAFAEFEKGRREAPPLQRLRQGAIERFAALGFPTTEDEEWRFTNLAPLTRVPFRPATGRPPAMTEADLRRLTFSDADCHRLVFVNGRFAPDLSTRRPLPEGVILGSLAGALRSHADKVEPHLARYADYEEQALTALNTAFFEDGAFLFLPRNQVVDEPIHLVFVSAATGGPTVAHPRNLIVAGVSSQVRLVESYVGLGDEVYFTNAVTEVAAGENARIDHCRLQRESKRAFHIAALQVHQDRCSNFTSQAVTFGGGLVRNDIGSVLDAEGCSCTLNGLYLASGEQHVDNHTLIDHAKPHCESHELYKGILDGKAHGVFNGKIYVRQDAQKTDAKQTNQTLLLSEDATINTKPQLEIFADAVKCTHGATVGQLDAESVFYLRSRGIGQEAARALLTFAFANDIIRRVTVEPMRARLEESLLAAQRLPRVEEAV